MRSITLIPTGRLALLPLHAARLPDGTDVLDHFAVAYAPSATTLRHLAPPPEEGPPRLVGVGNPLPDVKTAAGVQAELKEAIAALEKVLQEVQEGAEKQERLPQRLLHLPSEVWQRPLQKLRDLVALEPETFRTKGRELREAVLPFLPLPGHGPRLWEAVARVLPSLPYARAELQSVADLWTAPADLFYEDEATLEALARALPGARYAHFACHGSFDPEEPAGSALHLAGEDRLALRDLTDPRWERALKGLRLAVLSACQTAITDFRDLPEEVFGLPVGFLAAGVPAVVGSLWPVDDRSTALLMHRFYELHLQGDPEAGIPPLPPLLALREAQRWLRTVTNRDLAAYLERYRRFKEAAAGTERMSLILIREERRRARREDPKACPYASPYHWAGFVFYGR